MVRLLKLVFRTVIAFMLIAVILAALARIKPPVDREAARAERSARQGREGEAEEEARSPAAQARAAWEARARATTREDRLATAEAARAKEEILLYADNPDAVVQGNYPWPVGNFTRKEQKMVKAAHDAGMLATYAADAKFGKEDSSPERYAFYKEIHDRNTKAVLDRIGYAEAEFEPIRERVVSGSGLVILPDTPRNLTLEEILARFN